MKSVGRSSNSHLKAELDEFKLQGSMGLLIAPSAVRDDNGSTSTQYKHSVAVTMQLENRLRGLGEGPS